MRLLKLVPADEAVVMLSSGAPTQLFIPRKISHFVDSIVYAKRSRPWSRSYTFAEQSVISQTNKFNGTWFVLGPLRKTEFSVLISLLRKPCLGRTTVCAACDKAVVVDVEDRQPTYHCNNFISAAPKTWCYID